MRCLIRRAFRKLSAVVRILPEVVRLFHGVLLGEGHREQRPNYNERLGETFSMLMNVCSVLQRTTSDQGEPLLRLAPTPPRQRARAFKPLARPCGVTRV